MDADPLNACKELYMVIGHKFKLSEVRDFVNDEINKIKQEQKNQEREKELRNLSQVKKYKYLFKIHSASFIYLLKYVLLRR